jgi:hypothetical protein
MTFNWDAVLHGQNSTEQPVWRPNPTARGTWNIYQTCVVGKSMDHSDARKSRLTILVCAVNAPIRLVHTPSRAVATGSCIDQNSLYVPMRDFQNFLLTQTLTQTIFLCVWQAIHLNIPPPGEPPYRQMVRKAGWSILAIIAPEIVALNAWLQYCEAQSLMASVNRKRGLTPRHRSLLHPRGGTRFRYKVRVPVLGMVDKLYHLNLNCVVCCVRGLCDWLGRLFSHAANGAREIMFHHSDWSARRHEQRRSNNENLLSQLDNDQIPWTMGTAFYAGCGGAILVSDYGMAETLSSRSIRWLANDKYRSLCLLPLQRAALQDPSKASELAKLITCTQALWFCAECIARLCNNMAISLLELNTFAHCISAFCIYAFWWHKPYDVLSHAHVTNFSLYQDYLFSKAIKGIIVGRRGHHRSEVAAVEHDFPLTINEKETDASLTLLGSLETSEANGLDLDSWPRDHQIKTGHKIPNTRLVFSTPREAGANIILLTNEAMAHLKQIWLIRVAYKIHNQPSTLGVLKSWRTTICSSRVKNSDPLLLRSWGESSDRWPTLIMILVALVYGGMHLLAWQYHFQTRAESIVWRTASMITAASGLVVPAMHAFRPLLILTAEHRIGSIVVDLLFKTLLSCCFVAVVVARSFLVIESFRALPNSSMSVYEIPRWTGYFPHF